MAARATNWGSVPEWLAGVGTVLAVVFAVVGAVITYRTFVCQPDEFRESRTERVESQARTIAAWFPFGGNDASGCRVRNPRFALSLGGLGPPHANYPGGATCGGHDTLPTRCLGELIASRPATGIEVLNFSGEMRNQIGTA